MNDQHTPVFARTLLTTAVVAALGLGTQTTHAASVTGLTIMDVGSNTANAPSSYSATLDGRSGAFRFSSSHINVSTYFGTTPFTGDVLNGTLLGGGAANPTGSFSTGFIFAGAPFVPYTYGAGFQADITGSVLTISSLDFGGNYGGAANFDLPPDNLFPAQVLWVIPTANSTDFYVAFRWGHNITTGEDPTLNYTAFTAQWVLEGCASTVGNVGSACGAAVVPVPAAGWLLGSGIAGLIGVSRRRRTRPSQQQ